MTIEIDPLAVIVWCALGIVALGSLVIWIGKDL